MPITVNGTISKVYDKTDTVTVATLSLSYNLDGADLTFSGVYDGSHVDAGNNLPVVFTLSGSASPNYLLTGDYYGTILRRAVAILITGEITKVYDKTSNVIFEAPNNAVLDSQNIDGEDLSFYGNYANNHQDVTPSSPVVFTLTGTAAPNYMVEGSYTGSITPKLITVTYTETSQSYRSPVVDVGAVVNTNDIVEGDSVTATVDMSGVAQTHNRFTRYSGLLAVSDNPNYYVDASNDTDLYFRYFYLADGETSIFRIESIDDLDMLNSKDFFHDYLTLDYLLVNDIDNGKKVFSMIEGEYSGDFDGNGKVLSGLVLLHVGSEATDANPARLALFEALAAEGSIRNLKVVNTSLNNYDNHTITAGLVAYHEGSIINCVFEGEIYAGPQTSLSAITGGIAGISLGSIQNSSAVAIIVAESANAYTGGIAGKLEGQAAVADSVGFVEITATAATTAISGGVIGQNDSQALQSGNTYLADASLINGVILTKAIGNDTDETGENYGAIALDNPTLASVVSLYRIGSYAPCQGTPNQPIVINNYRQMVLLSQFRWASFTLNADIAFPTAYVHTPEKGVFCGTLSNGSGSSYTITLPPATPLIYKKLFDYEIAGAIMVTVA
ncbi:MAG: YDG domain-containing protein [Clostridia bacterium]|nr:YDG domain-containing protein [Clostridia bacterium]